MSDPIRLEVVCDGCDGDGWFPVTVPVCCNRTTSHGECCGDPEPGQQQEQCAACSGTGKQHTLAAPESLTEAMMELAEAVMHADDTGLRLDLSFAIDGAIANVKKRRCA